MFKRASIIIPALNEEKFIDQCLSSLLSLEVDHLQLEIIVVDNGSSDSTVAIAKSYVDSVFVKKGVNISALRNIGAAKSKGDLLAFVDADCVVSSSWLGQAIQCMNRESVDAVGSFHSIPQNYGWIGRTAELIQSRKVGSEVGYIPSGNLLIKRYCFETVGGFDESLETDEDVELCHRLKNAGYNLFLDPKIVCTHLDSPKNIKEMFLRELWHGKNAWTVFFRDLQKVKNLNVSLYSAVNLLLILGVLMGVCLNIFSNTVSVLIISLFFYLILNFAVALRDRMRIKNGFFPIFFYVMIYGAARSLSFLKWILG